MKKLTNTAALVALALLVVAPFTMGSLTTGCVPDGPGPAGPTDSGTVTGRDSGPPGPAPTFYGDVRPILFSSCLMCHADGGIGPFPLGTYEEVRGVGERVRDATRDRIMPPFLADNSGACNTWSNARTLSQEEIDIIDAWYEGGMQEGDPATPEPPEATLPTLPSVDVTVASPEYTFDTSVDDDYRCFVVDPGITSDTYVIGYDVRPGNLSRVHHLIVYNPSSDAAAADAAALEAAAPGPGYPCYGGASVPATPLVLWAPGTGATLFPEGTGLPLPAGRRLVIQFHYNLINGSGDTDTTQVDLALSASVTPAQMVAISNHDISLPPRMALVEENRTVDLPIPAGATARVWGALPHMHGLGVSGGATLIQGGTERCLLDVPRWDYNWQLGYFLDEPITVRSGDRLRLTCRYNTMSRDTTTTWGEGTQDEMCITYFYATP